MRSTDVLIVGAGPAGSSAAITLARLGYSVALLDREQFPREKLCGDFINPSNWPILRALGVERDILARAHQRVTGFRITSVAGDQAECLLPLTSGEPFGLGLSRAALDHILVEKAQGENVTVLQSCRIQSLEREETGWRIGFNACGSAETLRAQVLIGADGRHSWVAHRLGLAGSADMRGRAVAFQLRLRCRGGFGDRVEIHLFPGGYVGLLGLGGNLINLCLAVEKDRLPDDRPFARLLESRLPLNPHLKTILNRSEPAGELRSTYPVYFSPRRSYGNNVLLAGDAARVNEPVSGEGIYFALKSGLLAAETTDAAFRAGDFSAARLRGYESSCRSEFRLRRGVNALIRALIYRPALASPLIRFSAKRRRLLDSIVRTVCLPDAAR
jgi:geranylgeranyl reductase family protein